MSEPRLTVRESEQAQAGAVMETMIGYLLLGGVVLSIALTVGGLLRQWRAAGAPALDYRLADVNLRQVGARA